MNGNTLCFWSGGAQHQVALLLNEICFCRKCFRCCEELCVVVGLFSFFAVYVYCLRLMKINRRQA
jgi:hypothetical protein